MNREVHVRICGGLEVRFLRSTRLCIDYNISSLSGANNVLERDTLSKGIIKIINIAIEEEVIHTKF
jgi:hypothetical protein